MPLQPIQIQALVANETDRDNLTSLLSRKSGQRFKAVDGKLVKLTWTEKVKYTFSSEFRNEAKRGVKEIVGTTVSHLKYSDQANLDVFRELFTTAIAPLSEEIFAKREIKNAPCYNMLQAQMLAMHGSRIQDGELKAIYVETQVADWLGRKIRRNIAGTSGSYICFDLDGNKRAIVKPVTESPHGENNPHFWIRLRNLVVSIFFSSHRCTEEHLGHIKEECAFAVCQTLGWDIVPKTAVVAFASFSLSQSTPSTMVYETVSFAAYVPNAKDGFDQFGVPSFLCPSLTNFWLWKNDERVRQGMDEATYKKYAILQWLLMNIDGNLGNLLFNEEGTKAIDWWFSLPYKHPDTMLDSRGLNTWGKLLYANAHITAADIQDVLQNQDRIKAAIRAKLGAEADRVHPESNSSIMSCFEDRIAILRKYANENKTYRQLSQEVWHADHFREQLGRA